MITLRTSNLGCFNLRVAKRLLVVPGVAVAVLLPSVLTAPASAEGLAPWWGLTTGERPTNLLPGVARDDVERLTVNATEGEFILAEPVSVQESKEGTGTPLLAFFPYNASHEELQEGLETIYGAGNVTVSGGPEGHPLVVGTGHNEPYTVTFTGALADGPVRPMYTELSGLVGFNGELTVTEQTQGRPDGQIIVTAENRGDASTSGKITIVDKLPAGLEAVGMEGIASQPGGGGAVPVTCPTGTEVKEGAPLACTFGSFERHNSKGEEEIIPEILPPYEEIELRIAVVLKTAASSGEQNTATVSGGGAGAVATVSHPPIEVNSTERFGVEDFQVIPENVGGTIDTQAGSHPFQLTSVTTLNSGPPDPQGRPRATALSKDIVAQLPPGLIGNPTPFAQCTDTQFSTEHPGEGNECPAQSGLGVATLTFSRPEDSSAIETVRAPIFNMVPRAGEPARFGFGTQGLGAVFLDTSVRTGGDYGVTVGSSNITEAVSLLSVKLTFWGVPGDASHNALRGNECFFGLSTCPHSTTSSPPPFLVMPTSCGSFETTVHADSWAASGKPSQAAQAKFALPETVDGCNHLPFAPEIKVTPDGTAASTPTGLNVDVHVPQDSVLKAESLAESAVKEISVALPEGVAVNPAGSDGLQACTEGQIGFTGEEKPSGTLLFTPTLPEPFCPSASKIGTVEIASPLLPPGQHLKGAVYLASQNENPFASLIALYIVAEDPISGVLVKLPGETHLSPTGQIIGTFKNTPQLAFEDAELHFFGGERAPLATPARCGPYTTNATFTPWSGNELVHSSSTFDITSGPNGSPCPGASLPFSPSLTGGTTNINAGGFSPLVTTISRADGQQNLQQVTLHMPAGLEGLLSNVKLCPEAQANEGTCGPESLIGETVVSAGVGSDPVSVTGGKVYITEKYTGAPFGLSIVNPVKAGPFDLEHDTANPAQDPACDCVVVRAKIEVNPATAELTITTDASGAHAIPHLIDGIPVQIKAVNVTVNREHFTFNPTNCNPMSLTGSIGSDEGASSPLSVPFQATNCAVLKYTPTLTVSTAAKASRANGASLSFKIAYPKGAMGSQSWMKEMKFVIPKQLPARLTTLQKACLAHVFETERQNCPTASIIGHVLVHTPVLPVPLEGPLYFVSYGGAAFPDAVAVLHGYGLTIESHGHTLIKNGVTSATFEAVPDVPFESIEVTVPQGPFSEFGANLPHERYDFCGQHLKLPVLFKAQNGAEIHAETPVGVTGCSTKASIASHKVKAHNITLSVYVPAAGRLTVGGKGLSSATKRAGGIETLTLTIHPKHRGKSSKRHIRLVFTPARGRKQTLTITLRA